MFGFHLFIGLRRLGNRCFEDKDFWVLFRHLPNHGCVWDYLGVEWSSIISWGVRDRKEAEAHRKGTLWARTKVRDPSCQISKLSPQWEVVRTRRGALTKPDHTGKTQAQMLSFQNMRNNYLLIGWPCLFVNLVSIHNWPENISRRKVSEKVISTKWPPRR